MSDNRPQVAVRFLTLGIELTTGENECLKTIHETLDRLTQRRKGSPSLGTPRGLLGRNGLMAVHSKSVSSYLMIRGSGSGA